MVPRGQQLQMRAMQVRLAEDAQHLSLRQAGSDQEGDGSNEGWVWTLHPPKLNCQGAQLNKLMTVLETQVDSAARSQPETGHSEASHELK